MISCIEDAQNEEREKIVKINRACNLERNVQRARRKKMTTTKLNQTSTCVYVKKRRKSNSNRKEEKKEQNPIDVF